MDRRHAQARRRLTVCNKSGVSGRWCPWLKRDGGRAHVRRAIRQIGAHMVKCRQGPLPVERDAGQRRKAAQRAPLPGVLAGGMVAGTMVVVPGVRTLVVTGLLAGYGGGSVFVRVSVTGVMRMRAGFRVAVSDPIAGGFARVFVARDRRHCRVAQAEWPTFGERGRHVTQRHQRLQYEREGQRAAQRCAQPVPDCSAWRPCHGAGSIAYPRCPRSSG